MIKKILISALMLSCFSATAAVNEKRDKKTINAVKSDTVATVNANLQDSIDAKKMVIIRKDTMLISSKDYNFMTPYRRKEYARQLRRDSIRARKPLWITPFGGPSYTPEASLGIGGAVLASFKINKNDSISYRSFLPVGINLSINGTIVVAGAGTFFMKENKFRIYASYGYRNEPSNYYGKGYSEIDNNHRSDSTTLFKKENIQIFPRFLWEVYPHLFVGPLFELNYTRSWDMNPVMEQNSYVEKFRRKYLNIALGGVVQYDTRDDIATPNRGFMVSATGKIFSKYLGGVYDYQLLDVEYRQFQPLFKRALLAWTARTQMSFGNVPFTDLPMFGTPFDLRGYYWGKYRDKTMAYAIAEYRQMFGTQEDLARGRLLSKFGFVAWVGTGTIGSTMLQWNKWKFNYGAGLRVQIQPRKNLRLDIGKEHGVKGMLFYMNMTEAF